MLTRLRCPVDTTIGRPYPAREARRSGFVDVGRRGSRPSPGPPSERTPMRASLPRLIGLAALAAALLPAAPAAASQITSNGSTVTYTAAPGESNSVLVSKRGLRHLVRLDRRAVPVGLRQPRAHDVGVRGLRARLVEPDLRRHGRVLGPDRPSSPTSATATTPTGAGTAPTRSTGAPATTIRSPARAATTPSTAGSAATSSRAGTATTCSTAARATTTSRGSRTSRRA